MEAKLPAPEPPLELPPLDGVSPGGSEPVGICGLLSIGDWVLDGIDGATEVEVDVIDDVPSVLSVSFVPDVVVPPPVSFGCV